MNGATPLTGGWGGSAGLSGQLSASGLGPWAGCGQNHPLMPMAPLAGARHPKAAKPSQYLLLLFLLAVSLDPEGSPGPPSCSGAPGRNPSLQWPRLPAPQSDRPGAGRGACESRESASGQGAGRSYAHVSDRLLELGGGDRKCLGLTGGETTPSHALALILESCTS